jgi:hypothetical protein
MKDIEQAAKDAGVHDSQLPDDFISRVAPMPRRTRKRNTLEDLGGSVKEAMNKPPENEFEDWLNEHGPEMEGEDDCESLMFAAWKAAQLSPSCMNCAAVDLLIQRVQELEKALERLSRPRDCGCVPCRGQCTDNESLLIEGDEMRHIARTALAGAKESDE